VRLISLAAVVASALAGCSLNPQPLPPGDPIPNSAGAAAGDAGTLLDDVGDDGGTSAQSTGATGESQSSGAYLDGGALDSALEDVGSSSSVGDGGTAGDAASSESAQDAATDAPVGDAGSGQDT
jgi:hypothetical protein